VLRDRRAREQRVSEPALLLDGNDEDVPYHAIGTQHGQGCTAAGRSKPLSCYAYFGVRGVGPRHTFSWAGFEAPTSTPGLLCLGLTQLTLALPELCAPLQLFPIDVTLPIASAGRLERPADQPPL
jgi:hypothetical protein